MLAVTRRTRLVLVLAVVLVAALLLPALAGATRLKGDRIEWYKPKSISSSKFSIKAKVMMGFEGSDSTKYITCKGSKTKTVFYITTRYGDSYKRKKVGYATFKRYFAKERWRPVGSADYVWKTSSGKRYRYLKKIDITFYAD